VNSADIPMPLKSRRRKLRPAYPQGDGPEAQNRHEEPRPHRRYFRVDDQDAACDSDHDRENSPPNRGAASLAQRPLRFRPYLGLQP
jgi:hypothetical protein